MSRIITIGEVLGEFIAEEQGDLRNVNLFRKWATGSELTYAVAMTRLGHQVDFITKVGNDPLGMYLIDFFKANKINTDYLDIVKDRRTGIELKENSEDGWPMISYFRKYSAASTMTKYDVRRANFEDVDHMHITGIPVALSESCREAVMEMIYQAHQNDITVSFDPNLRPDLWDDELEMKKVLNGITILCDIVFPEMFEAQKLLGTDDPDQIADFYISAGVKTVVIRMGEKGIFIKNKKERFIAKPIPYTNVVDMMGVGDGFAAGVTSALLEGRSMRHAIERGRIIGAHMATSNTSHEGAPTREELISLVRELYGDDYYDKLVEVTEDYAPVMPEADLKNEQSELLDDAKERIKQQVDPLHTAEKNEMLN